MTAHAQIVPLARSHIYRFLAHVFADPSNRRLEELQEQMPLLKAGIEVQGDQGALEAARRLGEALDTLDEAALQASHLRCFGHGISKECPPYEAEYGQAHIFQKSQCLADIVGFYRAFGLDLAADFRDRADHVCAELEFMQWLCLKQAHALSGGAAANVLVCEQAQSGFLRDHIGRWTLNFAGRLEAAAPGSFHARAAALLAAFVRAEARAMGVETAEQAALNEAGTVLDDKADGCAACVLAGEPADQEER